MTQSKAESLLSELREYSGLTNGFSDSVSLSPEAHSFREAVEHDVTSASEEYIHNLSAALDINASGKHGVSRAIGKISAAWAARQEAIAVLQFIRKSTPSEINKIIEDPVALNDLKQQARKRSQPPVEITAEEAKYKISELNLMMQEAQAHSRMQEANLIADLRRRFLDEMAEDNKNEIDPSYTPMHQPEFRR